MDHVMVTHAPSGTGMKSTSCTAKTLKLAQHEQITSKTMLEAVCYQCCVICTIAGFWFLVSHCHVSLPAVNREIESVTRFARENE